MKRLSRPRLVILIAALTILAVPAGGVAYAYWRSTGIGNGTGTTGTTVPVTLSSGTPSATLYPGGQTAVVLTATNTNAAIVHINSLALNASQGTGGFSVDSGHSGCSVAALSLSTQTNGGAGWDVPARVGAVNGTLSITLSNALALSSAAIDACQGATFTAFLAAG
jgi:hypothetical protein